MSYQIHPRTSLGTVELKVSNLERSILFYTEVVGFKVLHREGNIIDFTADGVNVMLRLEELENAVERLPRSTTGLYHFAILVPDRKSLGLSVRQLIAKGIRVGQGDHGFSEALYISDPDRNGIEIYADRPKSEWRDANGDFHAMSNPVDIEGLLAEAGDEPWEGLSKGTTIGHVHFHVGDLKTTEAFYCGLLGFDAMIRMMDQALFISAGGYHHHIGLNTWAGVGAPPPPPNAVGLKRFTILLPSQSEVDAILANLAAANVSYEQQQGGWFVTDPSGIGILLAVKAD
jgi:catechol 2,3-dioxygenase